MFSVFWLCFRLTGCDKDTVLFFKSKWQAIYVNNAFQSPKQNYTISKNDKPTTLIVSGVKTTSVMLKTKKENRSCYQSGNVWVTLQLLNFHISRKRMSVKLLQPYVTFNQPLSQVRKSLPTSAYLGKCA